MPTQNGTQPQPPLHQRPPPPRHAISEGVSQTRFQRSDSAPPYPQQSSTTMMGSLVVNLGRQTNLVENRNIAQGPAERSRFPPTSPLPPPPAPKSVCPCFSSVQSRNLPWGVCVCVCGGGDGQEGQNLPSFFSSWPLLLALFRLQSIKHCCVISVYSSRFPPFKNSHLPVFPFPSPIPLPPILPGLHPLSSPLSSYIKLLDTPKRIPVLGCPSQTNGMYTKTLYENCLKYFCP